MHGTHSRLARRGVALAAAALVGLSTVAAACASAKKPAQQDSQAAQPDLATGGPGGGRFGGPGGRDARLFAGITLSDAQRAQVDSIRASYRDRMTAARQGGGDRSQMRQMMQEQTSAIRAVLTPEQQATFDKNVEQMRSERGQRRPGSGSDGGQGGGSGR